MAFPATEFTASDDGLAGVQQGENRQLFGVRPRSGHVQAPLLRVVDGIATPMKPAPLRHCSRGQRDQSYSVLRSTSCARPPGPVM